MHHITLTYRLRNGHKGTLDLIACSTCGAILQAFALFGHRLRVCSARVRP